MVAAGQLPLPVTPVPAVPISLAAGLVESVDGAGQVFINGQLSHTWDAGDRVCRRLAAVQLVKIGAATKRQAAQAFGVNTSTVYRWQQRQANDGAAGLVPERTGPVGPSKLTEKVIADIRARRAVGVSMARIADEVGVSVASVHLVLTRPAVDEPADVNANAGDDGAAGGGVGNLATGTDRDVGGDITCDGEVDGDGALPVLPGPDCRDTERALAHAGLLDHARPRFVSAARVPLAGLLLAIPALVATGLLDAAKTVYGRLADGFYGLEATLIEAVLRTLADEPRAEGTTRIDPAALGRVLGLDRSPEVKTIRRKIGQLAGRGKAATLLETIAARQLHADGDTTAVLYVDGHVRTYHGTRKIQKTHVSRLRFPAPATQETWINDANGQPVWMVMAQPGNALTGEIRRLMPEVRRMIGDDRRVLVGFDREGWSPALFADMIAQGFDVITWRKGHADDIDPDKFSEHVMVDEAGIRHSWLLADTTVKILFDERKPDKGQVTLRQVTKRDADTGRQAHIVTSRTDLAIGEVVHRMGSRWRQENYFRMGRMRMALDAHDSYQAGDDDGDRMVPNPAKKQAYRNVQAARSRLTAADIESDRTFLELKSPAAGEKSVITSALANQINQPVFDAEQQLEQAKQAHAATPTRLPLSQVRPGQQILETETKLVTHAIRMATYNTQTTLARTVRTSTGYARAQDEAHTLIRTAVTGTGDIRPNYETGILHVRLDPLPTPRATKAIGELCDALNNTETYYPDTNLKMHYTVKPHR